MPPRTLLPNKYLKYFIIKPYEWHQNKIGYYHVSQIGANNQRLEPKDHSGPCLRDTFYGFIPIDVKLQSLNTQGNFGVGNIFHPHVENIQKTNNPFNFPEFPLQKLLDHDGQKIIVLGSIDLPRQKILTFDDNADDPIPIHITDLKTASDYTFPYDNSVMNRNPTHFDQVYIYGYWLINYYLNSKYNKLIDLTVAYINKHEAYTGEQVEKYDNDHGVGIFIDFITRAFTLDTKLRRFMKIYSEWCDHCVEELKGNEKNTNLMLELKIQMNECLPTREPHKWCKFCDNRFRCRDNVVFDCDVRKYSVEEIEVFYKNETGKNAYWRGKHTKAFEKYAYGFKLEDNEL